ncbi:hypothetical protein [Aurantibacillus circumpalustris]|uniref:hypothetical protein n=1 Tax=Aurantibacillus circumpalustris TaxID=3036359 RepID=UPI00295B8758|nr:hypothetical protein [Aurantibacillus circumpalustris]
MINGLQISIPQRMMLLRITVTISLAISVLLSIHLWAGNRVVPYTSIIGVNPIKAPFDFIYVFILVLLWAASLLLNKQRLILFFAFVISILLVLFDINRLQPWFYIYNALLLIFLFYNGRVDDSNKFTAYFIILQIIIASVYFFCGLSQLNKFFVSTDFLEIISPLQKTLSGRQFLFLKKVGYVVPYVLMFIGVGLIISPIRYLAITLGFLLHLFLLIFLFPSENNKNYALWFSNLSFMVMLFLLFSGKTKQRYFSPTFLFQVPLFYAIMALFVVMPFFNNSGKWPDFLSANFRSGNTNSAVISLSNKTLLNLPTNITRFCSPNYGFQNFNYSNWFLHELHADCFPQKRVFNSIYNYVLDSDKELVKEIELLHVPKQKLLLKP